VCRHLIRHFVAPIMKNKTDTSNHLPVCFGGSAFFAWISAPPPHPIFRVQAKSLVLNFTGYSLKML
jgi:hypothetical protein